MKNETIGSILEIAGYAPDFREKIPDNIKSISDLTGAEIKFFFDCRSGRVDLETPLSSTAINGSLKDKIIRSELLEWALTPEMSPTFFPQGKLVLVAAIIDRYVEVLKDFKYNLQSIEGPDSKRKRKKPQTYSLDLSFYKIDIDLVFLNCIIRGGVNFRSAVTRSLSFNKSRIGYTREGDEDSKIYLSFNGDNLTVEGDLKINSWVDPHESSNKITSRVGPKEKIIQVYGAIRLHYTNVSRQLNFNYLVLGKWGEIDTYFLRSNNLFMHGVQSESCIDLTFANITELLGMTDSVISGMSKNGYSIDAARITANDIIIRNGVQLKYGLSLFSSHITTIDLTGVVLFSNLYNDIALDLRSVIIKEDIYFTPRRFEGSIQHISTSIFGKMLLDNATIKNLDLFRIRIIYKLNKIALSVNNATINGRITFSRGKQSPSLKMSKVTEKFINKLYERVKEKRKACAAFLQPRQSESEMRFFQNDKAQENGTPIGDFFAYLYMPDLVNTFRAPEIKKDKKEEKDKSEEDKPDEQTTKSSLPAEYFWMQDFKNAYEYLCNDIRTERPSLSPEDYGDLITETAIIVGEASFEGVICKEQLDCASAFFYGMDPGGTESQHKLANGDFVNGNALSLNYAVISGQLFLNEGADYCRPFRAYGKVNLHSSKVDQFFISPKRGAHENVQWKIVGMKYEYIYSNEKGKTTELEACKWFHDYDEENNRQPYEQLALAYFKAGDDMKARHVLIKTIARDEYEKKLMRVLSFFVWTGSPPYMALAAFLVIGFFGFLIFSYAAYHGGIVPINVNATVIKLGPASTKIEFSPLSYSFQQIIPFIPFDQKNLFAPSYRGIGIITAGYQFLHSLLGTIYLTMFIIGITRIVRRH